MDPWEMIALRARERMANQDFAARNRESQLASRKAIMDALNQGLATGVGAYGKYVDDQNARQQREQDMAFRREQFDYGKASDARDAALAASRANVDDTRANEQLALSRAQEDRLAKGQAFTQGQAAAEQARQDAFLNQYGEYLGLNFQPTSVGGVDMIHPSDEFGPALPRGQAGEIDSFAPAPPQAGAPQRQAAPPPSPEAQAMSNPAMRSNPLIQKAIATQLGEDAELNRQIELAMAKQQRGEEPTFEEKERIRAQMKLALQVTDPRNRTATPEQKQEAASFIRGADAVLGPDGGQVGGGGVGEVAGADPAIVAALQRAKKPVTPYNIQMAQTDPEVRAALGL